MQVMGTSTQGSVNMKRWVPLSFQGHGGEVPEVISTRGSGPTQGNPPAKGKASRERRLGWRSFPPPWGLQRD